MGYREEALKAIRALIFSGALPVGVKTSEREVSEHLDGSMSRTPIREALAVLTQTGVVVQYPQVGLMIRSVGLEEAIEALQLRRALEAVTVAKLAVNLPEDAVNQLRLKVKDLENASSFAEVVDVELGFHGQVAALAGYESAIQPLSAFMDKMALYRLTHGSPNEVPSIFVEEHRALVDAIEVTDPVRASEALNVYLDVMERRLNEAHNQEPVQEPVGGVYAG